MLKIKYKDQIGYENKRLENEIHSRMTAYRASVGGEELTMMQCWIIRFLYEHKGKEVCQQVDEAEFSIARSNCHGNSQTEGEKRIYSQSQCERDARLKKLELTALGVDMEEGTIRNINQMEGILRQGISDEDLEVFFRVIRKAFQY